MTGQLVLAGVLMGLAVAGWPGRPPAPQWATPPANGFPAAAPGGSRQGRSPGGGPLTSEDVASSMVLLALALQSGCGVVEAIEHVAGQSPGRPGQDLSTVAAALQWGIAERGAWAAVDPAWRSAGQSLRLATRAGVGPSGLLLKGASDMRAGELARLEVDAARVGVRLVLPLGLTFLPAFCLTGVVPIVIALARQVLAS